MGEPAFEDLTARARIRDAALRLFAERGIEATTIRDIARAARVSGGLVRHHFGSKGDLRAMCDSYVLAQIVQFKKEAVLEGRMADPGFLSSSHPHLLVMLRYFARSTLDGSPAADAMFSEMVGLAERWLDEHHPGRISDPPAYAALLVAMEIGALVIRQPLSRSLGADVFGPEGHARLVRAKLDFYSTPLLSSELADAAASALTSLEPTSRPTARAPRGDGP